MTFYLNKVMLAGRLGADPEIVDMGGRGGKVAKLSLATQESWKDKASGEWKRKTHWHRVSVYPPALVRLCEDRLKKGAPIYVEGQLDQRRWQKEGQNRQAAEIAIKPFVGSLILLERGSAAAADHDGEAGGD